MRIVRPSAFARRMGLYRGLLAGNRFWLWVGGVFWMGRFLRRFLGRTAELAATEVLAPGQFVTITALTPLTRGQRRAAKRG